ncbi:MAG: alpha,alpha-trehalase [Clostridia bacterium]|nr:alpha,alpha-trehalase [Clostridia bacterium]
MINKYIKDNLPRTIRECKEDNYPFFALPKPYNVPCASGMFQEMYYWDTYFTNRGLILDGDVMQAKNNVENLSAMAERFGFVLNGNRAEFINNSQPPFLSQAIREIYDVTHDREWLLTQLGAVEKEYRFYTNERGSKIGLSHYDAVMPISDSQKQRAVDILATRLGYTPDATYGELARGLYAVGESGWDINPRMTYRAYDYAVPDLNSLIYSIEDNMEFFMRELGRDDDASIWRSRKETRASLMRRYLKGDDGVFYDYDLRNNELSKIFSAASYYPLYFGLATEEEARAAKDKLCLLETDYGTLTSVRCDEIKGTFQWGYPNGWPPMQQIIVFGLLKYGYVDEARRIASKFLSLMEACFRETGHLWEKYDVVRGSADALAEYETPAMLGWTYSTYRVFSKLLNENEKTD